MGEINKFKKEIMLSIRLTRKGKKNQPFFRVVVIDKRRSAKGGRVVEVLGYIDP
ncbi:MAG: 30S ribosomal protein S16, partial [Candidatus Staskawiczbacteria bacterium]|nr:30S ribosomal protein S16 [Candidatus Staskawiczbacteria bacterium]